MGVFEGDDIIMWWINILTNYQFQLKDDNICELGHLKNFNFNFFGWLIQTQTQWSSKIETCSIIMHIP